MTETWDRDIRSIFALFLGFAAFVGVGLLWAAGKAAERIGAWWDQMSPADIAVMWTGVLFFVSFFAWLLAACLYIDTDWPEPEASA